MLRKAKYFVSLHPFLKMKYSLYIIGVVGGMCCMLFSACWFVSDVSDSDAEKDSIAVDSLGLEELDLFKETVIPKAADEVFDDFLFSYISNTTFATQRTSSGVEALTMNDEDASVMIYEREEDLVLQKDTSLQQVTMERIEWDHDIIHNYQFGKKLGQWFLNAQEDNDISDNPNASFLVFLKDFLLDSLYRHESIQLPLFYKFYSEEDEGMVETELSYEEWDELYNDLPRLDDYMYNIDYGQSLISTNRKSLLLKGLSNGLSMKFHFGFSDGRWQLIELE